MFSLVFLLFPFLLSCLSCDGFCRIPFRLRFFLLISSYLFLFFLMLHVHFFKLLLLPCDFFPPASCILYHPFCIFLHFHLAVRFSVWFCVLERSQNEGKNEGKIHDKQIGMDLARSWQAFFPILLLLRQLLLPPRGLVMLLLQAFVLPPPAKHQHHHHHCDDCW